MTEGTQSRLRLAVIGVIVMSLFATLLARLWYLQVLDTERFVVAAASNQVRIVYEEAPRGRILDRNGKVLVDNRRSQAITVERATFSRLDRASQDRIRRQLAALLGLAPEEVQKRIDDVRYSQFKPVPIADDVGEEIFTYVRERTDELPGVSATIVSRRSYPNGPLAAHLLGYVGEINDRELEERSSKGYRLGDSIGKSGVERSYEQYLRGTPGITKLQVTSTGSVTGPPLAEQAPVPGADVWLSIDLDLQRAAEEALLQGLEAARGRRDRNTDRAFAAPAGSAVVVDPQDGSVRAMASYPTYDPAQFVNGIRPDVFAALNDPASHYPLNNRVTQGQYAPGSTFKLITGLAAVDRGMITPNSTIVDRGVYTVPRCRGEQCTFRNAGSRPYGRVDLRRAVTVSSDVYFYDIGARFWMERGRFGDGIQEMARRYGFGAKTGIPLPNDRVGVIPDPEWKKDFCTKVRCVDDRWYTGDNINMSIGQGDVLATPLQLANAYAAFANGGTLYAPKVLDRVVDGEGGVVAEASPTPVRSGLVPDGAYQPMLEGLRGVVASREGTAVGAFSGFPSSFPVAGKTGTAEVRGKQDSALFVAFGPLPEPRYAVAVVLEEAGFGGSTAAPVARRILAQAAGEGSDFAPAGPDRGPTD